MNLEAKESSVDVAIFRIKQPRLPAEHIEEGTTPTHPTLDAPCSVQTTFSQRALTERLVLEQSDLPERLARSASDFVRQPSHSLRFQILRLYFRMFRHFSVN